MLMCAGMHWCVLMIDNVCCFGVCWCIWCMSVCTVIWCVILCIDVRLCLLVYVDVCVGVCKLVTLFVGLVCVGVFGVSQYVLTCSE